MTDDQQRLIELIKSWESGYISPSAQEVMRDARIALLEAWYEIKQLKDQLEETKPTRKKKNG